MPPFSRRAFTFSGAAVTALGLSGCAGSGRSSPFGDAGLFSGLSERGGTKRSPTGLLARKDYDDVYGRMDGERYPMGAFQYETVDPVFLRQEVAYAGPETPGSIVVDPNARFLYRVENRGRESPRVSRRPFGLSHAAMACSSAWA